MNDLYKNNLDEFSAEIISEKLSLVAQPEILKSPGLLEAAVLVPFIRKEDKWNLLFTLRTTLVKDHKGQVSFPGGSRDSADYSLLGTALREAWEEIGLEDKAIKILGKLPGFISVTNYFITPFVALVDYYGPFIIEKKEVEKIFLVPLTWLADKSNWELRDYDRGYGKLEKVILYKPFEEEVIWGITAYIVQELLKTLIA